MPEYIHPYIQLVPLAIGLLLFPLGAVVGSFSSVLVHRLPRKESIVGPRSHCPKCTHMLGPSELIPVISFLWQRGRCRHCTSAIPLRYLVLELLCGTLATAAGILWGWGGGFCLIGAWIIGASTLSRSSRTMKADAGISLVEVLLSVSLLVAVLVPMLEFSAYLRAGSTYPRELALTLAGSWMDKRLYQSFTTWPVPSGTENVSVGKYTFRVDWASAAMPIDDPDMDRLRHVMVTVTCLQGCPQSMSTVRMVRLFDQP